MAQVATDVVTRFAFEGSLEPLQNFNQTMKGGIKNLALFSAAIAAAGVGLASFVTNISQSNDDIGQMARNTGVSVEALGELSYAASVSGSSADAMQSSISSLSQKIGEASISGSEDFARMGISIRDTAGNLKTADQVMMEFSNRVKSMGLSRTQAIDMAGRLGIDDSLVQLLSKSSAEINQLRKRSIELGRVTTEQADSFIAYNDSLTMMGSALDGVKNKVAVELIPQLRQLANTMTNWLVEASDDIVAAFKFIIDVGGSLVDSLKRMYPVLLLVAGGFVAWKVATMGLVGALNLLKKTGVIAVFTSIYLLVDDLMTAFSDGESVIADFYSQITGGRNVVADLKALGQTLHDAFMPVWELFKSIWSMLSDIGQWIGSGIMDTIKSVSDWWSDDTAQPGSVSMDTSQMGGMMAPSTIQSANSNINQQIRIDVRSSDPVRAGEEVRNQLSRQTEDAYYQFGVGAR